jgi:hypothetical protein
MYLLIIVKRMVQEDVPRSSANLPWLGGGHGASHDQLPRSRIDDRVEPLEGSRSEQRKITTLAEDYLVDRIELTALDDRRADVARDVLPIGHHEQLRTHAAIIRARTGALSGQSERREP